MFPEPVQVIVTIPTGSSVKLVGKDLNSGQVHEPSLDAGQMATLEATLEKARCDGDPQKFQLEMEALPLGLASGTTATLLCRSPAPSWALGRLRSCAHVCRSS